MPSIGIPRALLFYEYYPLWKKFFEELGTEVIISGETNKSILDNGIKSCVDEACLPVKLFFGHVIELKDKVDYIFIPKFTSVAKREYICPKVGGLPDMVRHSISGLPPIIDSEINLYRRDKDIYKSITDIGSYFTADRRLIYQAYNSAKTDYIKYRGIIKTGTLPSELLGNVAPKTSLYFLSSNRKNYLMGCRQAGLNIAIIGHPYNVYDSYVNMGLIDKLKKMDVNVITIETLDDADINIKSDMLNKKMFWTFGRKAMGSTFHLIEQSGIDGVIFLMSFGCGIDAFICDLAERFIRRNSRIPFIVLTIDEHTGEAGMNTRIEAFTDMIRWRKADENNLPAHGKPLYNS